MIGSSTWMKWTTPVGLLVTGGLAWGGPDSWGEQQNRFGFNLRAGFGMEASFKSLGGFPARTQIGPPSAGYDHTYDDGYNKPDSSGVPGATWNWGYERASQVVNGDSIVFSSTSSSGTGQLDGISDDPHWGAEVTFTRELGWNGAYWWGVVAAVNWTDLRFADSASFTTDAVRTRDTYRVLSTPPPTAPYRGSYDIPGPQLTDLPSRVLTTLPGAARTQGRYELDGEGFGGRLGLLFETPFADWFDLQFGGGVAGMWVQSDFSLSETTTIDEAGTTQRTLKDSSADFVVGGYAEGGFSLRLSKQVNLHASAQYCYMTDYGHQLGNEEATISFKKTVFGVIGLNYAF